MKKPAATTPAATTAPPANNPKSSPAPAAPPTAPRVPKSRAIRWRKIINVIVVRAGALRKGFRVKFDVLRHRFRV